LERRQDAGIELDLDDRSIAAVRSWRLALGPEQAAM